MRRNVIARLGALTLLAAAPAVHATSQAPLNLADLVSRSPEIVVGTITSVHAGPGPGLPTTEVEMTVSDTLRGPARRTLTFRTVGPAAEAVQDGRRLVGLAPSLPRYAVGDHLLLFLGPTSPLGLRAPVGLQQGKFAIRSGAVQNDVQNQGLFGSLSLTGRGLTEKERAMVATRKGALDLSTFVSLVRRAVNENWWPGEDGSRRRRDPSIHLPGRNLPTAQTPTTLGPKGGAR